MKNRGASGIDTARGDRTFYAIVNAIVGVFMLIVLIPLVNIVASSFSSPGAVSSGKVLFWPVEFSLDGYKTVFQNKMIGTAYFNTFFYTIVGTMINLAMTMMAAYALARKNLPYKGFFMFLFTFTMLFSGGTIPNYMLIVNLKLYDTRWAMLLPGAISVYNMIIARTFIQNIPNELYEAASIDGCSDARYFFTMVIPLSVTLLSVLTLYYAVAHWNSYFDAFLYLTNRKLYPLQIVLREILIANSINANEVVDDLTMSAKQGMADLLKFSLIIVSSLPVLVLYPFVKKYFLKGVMIGALKG
ncbi:MAG: carbohydrate ABC transporter permease [Candidatus Faecivicinus sp.]|nr:carbohydrate ABC transporter permease [Candidatus Faecivicinus sp.]